MIDSFSPLDAEDGTTYMKLAFLRQVTQNPAVSR